jgi:CubicO group peptidase (beta-lactamase class C family)
MSHAMRHAVLAAVSALVLCRHATAQTPASAQRPSTTAVAARVDSLVREFMATTGIASVSVAVVRGDETLVRRAWGLADVPARRPAREETVYRLASISKQFTAALVLKQIDRGRLTPSDSIGRFLVGLPPEWRPITVEQLLNHTSGLPREFRFGGAVRPTDVLSPDSLLAIAARGSTEFAPGAKWAYSNVGYLLLGILVERLYEKPFAAVLDDEIARPLRLRSLGWCAAGSTPPATAAIGYDRSPEGTFMPAVLLHPSQSLGSGGLCASASDMAAWNRALHRGRVLSPASYAAMITPRGAAASSGYAFGLRTSRLGQHLILGHTGGTPGFAAEHAYVPAESLSVTVLFSTAFRQGGTPLFITLAREALGVAPPLPVAVAAAAAAPVQGGADALTAFVGEYQLSDERSIIITLQDGVLHGQPTGQQKLPLTLRSGTTFAVGGSGSGVSVTFTAAPDGRVTGMVMRQNGSERTLPKRR